MSAHRAVRDPRARASLRAIALTVGLIVTAPLLVSSPASAYWSVSTSATSVGRASAATVNAGSTPTATVASKNKVTVEWTATKLSNTVAVTGYTVSRYNSSDVIQTTLAGCSGTRTTTSCVESAVPDGRWTYRITPLFQNWVGAQGAASNQVLTDVTKPVNTISLVPTPNVHQNGTTVWVRTSAGDGNFRLSNALTDVTSGPASSASSLPTAGAGFSHTPGTVSTPVGGPYASAPYSWTLNAAGTPSARITGGDKLGNIAATTIAIQPDNTAPTGGAISYPSGQRGNGNNITIDMAAIVDSQSGVTASTRLLQYRSVAANGATCGAFGGWTDLLSDPPPSQVVNATDPGCYQFRYVFTDSVGNQTTTTQSANLIVRPYDNTVLTTPGSRSFWRLAGINNTIADTGVAANNGTWFNSPTLGQPGAIGADSNTSVLLDGINKYGRVTRQIQDNFSIEFWFKSTQGLGTTSNWYNGAGLVDAEVAGITNDFGISLMADGRVVAGVGNPDGSIASPAGKNDGNWHHVVFTRTRATGAIVLYVDGMQVGTATGGKQSLNASANIDFGRIQNGINYYKGNLDEIALYDVALPAATVLDHYNVAKLP